MVWNQNQVLKKGLPIRNPIMLQVYIYIYKLCIYIYIYYMYTCIRRQSCCFHGLIWYNTSVWRSWDLMNLPLDNIHIISIYILYPRSRQIPARTGRSSCPAAAVVCKAGQPSMSLVSGHWGFFSSLKGSWMDCFDILGTDGTCHERDK